MKLKLTYTEFTALYNLLSAIINLKVSNNSYGDKLCMALLAKTYTRFYKKAVFKKPDYKVSLPAEEALNWYCFFMSPKVQLPLQDMHINNLIRTINHNIHQQYQN